MSDRTRLSSSAADALETLHDPIEQTDGLSREEAATVLVDDGGDPVDAEGLLDELLSKGYLYAVDDHLYVTPS
ncbi:hypothetical protein [Natrinema gelatinilyticum]|uniref:hypothetical protein n=1 Tax=Natrinema gelatinilyticum TaxID=2961571 RepID=UPI0020C32282|nr:hypothetical protein [Natrinema gelatinilyticum]